MAPTLLLSSLFLYFYYYFFFFFFALLRDVKRAQYTRAFGTGRID